MNNLAQRIVYFFDGKLFDNNFSCSSWYKNKTVEEINVTVKAFNMNNTNVYSSHCN